MKINGFDEAESLLKSFVPPLRKFRTVYTLETMVALMNALGNPQEEYRVIHIAGTSGKTSTAYYAAEMLRLTGANVGLTVSPHVTFPNERVQVNGQPLAEGLFCTELGLFLDEVHKSGLKPTYFELLAAFAFWEFARQKVDYAVVEVGLGGLIDGTNVVRREDKVCVITDIGYDHTAVLGKTLPEIALQKAGIIQKSNDVFCYLQGKDVDEVIQSYATKQDASLHTIASKNIHGAPALVAFQKRNWFLARKAVEYVLSSDKRKPLTQDQLHDSVQLTIPGRLEKVHMGKRTFIFDGAHNSQKIAAFVDALEQQFPKQKKAALVALLKGPEMKYAPILGDLTEHFNRLVFTSFDNQQDLRKVATNPERLLKKVQQRGYKCATVAADPEQGLKELLQGDEEILVIVGSFYLLYELRHLVVK